jgi:hypothetical protein
MFRISVFRLVMPSWSKNVVTFVYEMVTLPVLASRRPLFVCAIVMCSRDSAVVAGSGMWCLALWDLPIVSCVRLASVGVSMYVEGPVVGMFWCFVVIAKTKAGLLYVLSVSEVMFSSSGEWIAMASMRSNVTSDRPEFGGKVIASGASWWKAVGCFGRDPLV